MLEVCIYGRNFATVEEVHAFMQRELDFPEYYGGNLSALYDVLTDICEPAFIRLVLANPKEELYRYLARVGTVLTDAAEENPNLEVEIVRG